MPKTSAGLLLYRRAPGLEVLLGHMGGPFWSGKEAGAWTIPKGEHDADEDPLDAARREFEEELGMPVPAFGGSTSQPSVTCVITSFSANAVRALPSNVNVISSWPDSSMFTA